MSWFAFDIDEYDADTMHLSLAQDGAYMRLLRFYYKTRLPLPDNDHALANIARTSIEEWDTMKSIIRAFFKSRRGRLHSKRADRELDREDSLARKRSDKAKNAADKRHKKTRGSVLRADIEHVPSKDTVMLGDATRPDQTRQKKDSDASASAPPSDSPLDLKREIWRRGRALFAQRGIPEAKSGPLFGKWRRDYHDTDILDALTAAEVEVAQDIIPFMVACLARSASGKRSKSSIGRANGLAEGLAGALMALGVEGGGACPGERREDFAGDHSGAIIIEAERSEGAGRATRPDA
jgi:uncharacterized protein YdaU (DUF1376 family)